MTDAASPITNVAVIATGSGGAHPEHLYGTSKPTLWWIFASRKWVTIPINVYVIEHADGLVLFDTGMDPAVSTNPRYWPDRVTGFFMRHIFRWGVAPADRLSHRLEEAGYTATNVASAVISHLHVDHVGGIADIPNAKLFVANEAWDHMHGPHPEREAVLRRDIEIPGANWHRIDFQPTTDPTLASFGESFDLMGDGSLIVLPTPGHLPGSVSMLVSRAEAPPLLLVGDLTYSEDLLMADQVPGTGDAEALRGSYAKVRALKEQMPDLVILPAHDAQAAEKLAKASVPNLS